MLRLRPALWLASALAFACGGSGADGSGTGAEGATGAGSPVGSGGAGGSPAATTAATTGTSSSSGQGGAGGSGGGPLDGYGALSGTCGDIDASDIASDAPQILDNTIDFTQRPPFDVALLSAGGQEIVADGNLGGSSLYSEVFAFEVLHRCEGAALLKTEGEIVYQTTGKKTDLLVDIGGEKVGVSVVRAMSFPEGAPYPVSQAFGVLDGKLADILESSANVAPEDAWPKQILAVVAQTPDHATAIEEAYLMVSDTNKADTIVYVTVTEGDDAFIYYE